MNRKKESLGASSDTRRSFLISAERLLMAEIRIPGSAYERLLWGKLALKIQKSVAKTD